MSTDTDVTVVTDPRTAFARTAADLVDEREDLALVWAEISGAHFADVTRRHPDRVVNVGIREQLLVSVGAGMALAGLRPIVHTFASFLVERPFEQVKLDFVHQQVGGVLVSAGGSFDVAAGGRTHQAPGDVALLDTLPGVRITAPGTAEETRAAVRRAAGGSGLEYVRVVGQTDVVTHALDDRFTVLRRGAEGVVVALGPVLDAVLAATEGLDVTVLHTATVRPFDAAGLREAVAGARADVVLVEPWLAGTSAHEVASALRDVPHRLLALGTDRRAELRRYGTPEEHVAAHGLDAAGLAGSLRAFWPHYPGASRPGPRTGAGAPV